MNLTEALNILQKNHYLIENLNWNHVFDDNPSAIKLLQMFESIGITIVANFNKNDQVFETIVSFGEQFNNNFKRLLNDMKTLKEEDPQSHEVGRGVIKSLNKLTTVVKNVFESNLVKDSLELRLIVDPAKMPVRQAYPLLFNMLIPMAGAIRVLDYMYKSKDMVSKNIKEINDRYDATERKLKAKYAELVKDSEQQTGNKLAEKIKKLMNNDDVTAFTFNEKIIIKIPSKEYANSLRATLALSKSGNDSCMKYMDSKGYFKNLNLPDGVEIAGATNEIIVYIKEDKFNEELLKTVLNIVKKYIQDFHKALKTDFGDKINGFYK